MSLLSNSEIKQCINNTSEGIISWTNNQTLFPCLECEKDTLPKNISMIYKCDGVYSYTLHCVCVKCVKEHLTRKTNLATMDKIESIKKENNNQTRILQSTLNTD